MNKNIIIISIIVLVLVGGYFLLKGLTVPFTTPDLIINQQINPPTDTAPTNPNNGTHEVMYSDSGYAPKELTIKAGETVTWQNESSHGMWTASALHPTHVIYSGTSLEEHCPDVKNTSFDECKSDQRGQSWSFTFDKKGTWRYHNHVQSSDFGTVIVQ